MNLYILQNFNNYTERKVKGYQTLTNYLSYLIADGNILNVNFNPNDGKYTNQVVMCDFDTYGYPDYLIVCDENDNIVSRWFIINTSRERSGKWRLDLKHDLVYDNIVGIVNNENTLIKKGYAPIDSPAVFNKEDFKFNEIKTSESYLKYYNVSGFDCFLIAYLPKTFGDSDYEKKLSSNLNVKLHFPNIGGKAITWETTDAPFDIYAIPFKSSWLRENNNELFKYKIVDIDGTELGSSIVQNTVAMRSRDLFGYFSMLSSFAYDIQIIPFTSISNLNVYMDGDTLICKTTYSIDQITFGDSIKTPSIYWYDSGNDYTYLQIPMILVYSSTFYININSNVIPLETAYYSHVVKACQKDKYRLVSPDYSSAIDIDKTSNYELKYDSDLDKDYLEYGFPSFNIHCKLQPIQPYIYIEPIYKGLYGNNYVDNRGMLCNYNFSLAQTSDKWAEFLLSNKNYLNTFNQEVKNLEIARTQSIIGGVSNTVGSIAGGAAGGAIIGSHIMPGVGTAVGAIVGGVSGAITGAYNMGENIYNSNRAIGNYKRSFKWSCENIQAMPNTLNKISTIVNSNKIFPIIEKYTCLQEELTNFGKYLYLNGQSIDMVGKIKDYWGGVFFPYIEAVLIRIDNNSRWNGLTADMLNEINKELDGGLFFDVIE